MTTRSRYGIPTTYREQRFRSRLEARWAAMFDLLGWPWVYEPIDAENYIPDFIIQGERPIFIEVGPCVSRADYVDKSEKPDAAIADLRRDVLVLGVSPLPGFTRGWKHTPDAGVIGEFYQHDTHGEWCLTGCVSRTCYVWGNGIWTTCAACGQTGIVHEYQSYVVRPCGHHPGSHIDNLTKEWSHAANRVQWRGRAA